MTELGLHHLDALASFNQQGPDVVPQGVQSALRWQEPGCTSAPRRTTKAAVGALLADLEQAGRSHATRHAYASDLRLLVAACPAGSADVTATHLRELFASMAGLALSTRARRPRL